MRHTLNIDGQEIAFNAHEKDAELIKRTITDLMTIDGFVKPGLEDVKEVVDGAENVVADEETASGESRCADAANEAAKNLKNAKKLLVKDAKKLLVCVTSGTEIVMGEILEAVNAIEEVSDPDAYLIWGHVSDESMGDAVKVSVIAAVFMYED